MTCHPRRAALAAISAILVLLVGGASVSSQSPQPMASYGPDTPVASSPMASGQPMPGWEGATPAVPEDGLVRTHPQPWDRVDVASDGRTLSVFYWSGVSGCYGLASVDVTQAEGRLDIRLQTGMRPGVEACIEIAQRYVTIVTLDAPLITGGVDG